MNDREFTASLGKLAQKLGKSEAEVMKDALDFYRNNVCKDRNPVLTEKGEVEQFTLRTNGKSFRCDCGCNVFYKPNRLQPELYECNCCEAQYEAS